MSKAGKLCAQNVNETKRNKTERKRTKKKQQQKIERERERDWENNVHMQSEVISRMVLQLLTNCYCFSLRTCTHKKRKREKDGNNMFEEKKNNHYK